VKDTIETIKRLIADGDCAQAIDRLADLPTTVASATEDELILLKNRLTQLERSVMNGTLARDDEIIERNLITRSLLNLVLAVQNGRREMFDPPVAAPTPPSSEPAVPVARRLPRRGLLVAGSAAFLLLLIAAIAWRGGFAPSADAPAIVPDLSVRLVFRPDWLPVRQTGLAQIRIGRAVSETLPIPPDGVLHFRNMPAPTPDRPVQLVLDDLRYHARIAGQKILGPAEHEFIVELEQQTFDGRVVDVDLKPVGGVELEVENGLARTVSDRDGYFRFSVPKSDAAAVRLVLRRQGKVLVDRRVGLEPAVWKQLKIVN
jgi:hypothetical protein